MNTRARPLFRSATVAVLGAFFLVVGAHAVAAVPTPELIEGKRWAVIIAIGRYPEGIPGVTGSEAAATALGNVLRTQYGYATENVLLLVNEDATRNNIYRLQGDLSERVRGGDSVLVALMTQWESSPGVGAAMLPFDGLPGQPWTQVSYGELQQLMSTSRAATVLALIERCPQPFDEVGGYDSNAMRQQQVVKGASSAGSRAQAEVVAGCYLSLTRGGRAAPEELFLHHVVGVLREWQPGRAGAPLGIDELIGRVQERSGALEVARVNTTRQLSRFAFQRESADLDANLVAAINKESGDIDSRMNALARLAATVTLDAPGSARRVAAEAFFDDLYASGSVDLRLRAAAVGYAGQFRAVGSVPRLQALVQAGSEPNELRVAAIEAMAQIGDRASIDAILAAIQSPVDDVRAAAITAAAQLAPSEALEPILVQLKRMEGRDTVASALRALQRMGAPAEKTLATVIDVADSDFDATARREAIRLLGSYGVEEAFDPLMDILRNASEPVLVRQDAAYALGKLKLSDANRALAGQLLVQVLGEDQLRLQRAAADSVGRLNIVEARPRLESLLRNDRTPALRAAAASALALLKHPESRAALEAAAVKDSDASVRRAAVVALGEIGDERSIEALNRVLSDRSSTEEVRFAASQAINSIGSKPGTSAQWERILEQSKDPLERARAIGQLPARDDPAFAARLVAFLHDPSYEVRQAAIAKMVTLPGTAVIRELGAMIERPNDGPSASAATGLGEFGRTAKEGSAQWREALATLVRQPSDRSSTVRAAIVKALGWFADKEAIVAIGNFTRADDRQVRLAAADAYRTMGESFFKAGKAGEAVEVGRRALEMRQAVLGEAHPDVATELNNLGAYLVLAQDDAGAERHLQRALRIREAALGPDHPETAVTLSNLGALYRRRGDFKQAEAQLLRALSIRERALVPGDPLLAQTFDNVGALYRDMGDTGRAEKYTQRGQYLRDAPRSKE